MKPEKLYTGNTLTEENFNNIIEKLRGLENTELEIGQTEHNFLEGDDLSGSRVSFTRNDRGEIDSFSVSILEKTDRTPFYSVDGLVFENEDIQNVRTDSDFQVLRKSNGELIDGTGYGLNSNGSITFNEPLNENEVLVNGLFYEDQKAYFVGRDKDTREITRISSTPQEDTQELTLQPLVPMLLFDDSVDVITITDTDGEEKPTTSYYGNLFTPKMGIRFGVRNGTKSFIVDLKEQVIVEKIRFRPSALQNEKISFDISASRDNNSWTTIKRLRNITLSQFGYGNQISFEPETTAAFRYFKFENLSVGLPEESIFDLNIEGYHPENKDLLFSLKTGGLSFSLTTNPDGSFLFNEKVSISSSFVNTNGVYALPQNPMYYDRGNRYEIRDVGEWIDHVFEEPTEIKRIRFSSYRIQKVSILVKNSEEEEWTKIEESFGITPEGSDQTIFVINIDKPAKAKHYRILVDGTTTPSNYGKSIYAPIILE